MGKQTEALQEQWKTTRREQILDAAAALFAQDGYAQAKMKDVAKAAGVSNGTVYNYFKSKEEVLQALLHRLNETEKREADFAEGKALGSFRGFFGAYIAHRMQLMAENESLFQAVLPELMRQPALKESYRQEVLTPSFAMAEAFLEGMIEAGQLRDVDSALAARVMASQLLGLLMLRMLGDQILEEADDTLPALVTQVLCDGLLAHPTRAQPQGEDDE